MREVSDAGRQRLGFADNDARNHCYIFRVSITGYGSH
jgi:hypothetical protein